MTLKNIELFEYLYNTIQFFDEDIVKDTYSAPLSFFVFSQSQTIYYFEVVLFVYIV